MSQFENHYNLGQNTFDNDNTWFNFQERMKCCIGRNQTRAKEINFQSEISKLYCHLSLKSIFFFLQLIHIYFGLRGVRL